MELKGGDKLQQALSDIADKMSGNVSVGFFEGENYPDGTPVAAVAFWNEFGTTTIPPRPFFRSVIADKSGEWADKLGGFAVRYEYDAEKILDGIGQIIQQDIQQSIVGWTEPKNAESTERQKGFNKPLIESSQMQNGVEYKVET